MDIIIIAYDLIEIRFYHDYTQYCAERSNELVYHIRPPAEVLQFNLMLTHLHRFDPSTRKRRSPATPKHLGF